MGYLNLVKQFLRIFPFQSKDEQWQRAMEYVSVVSELNYMTQVSHIYASHISEAKIGFLIHQLSTNMWLLVSHMVSVRSSVRSKNKKKTCDNASCRLVQSQDLFSLFLGGNHAL